MKNLLVLFGAALVLAGCQCGPGIPCTDDGVCSPWGVCGAKGLCIVPPGTTSDGGAPRAVVPETQIDFGLVGCGLAPVPSKISVTNAGTGTLTVATSVVNGTVFAVTPPSVELGPDQTAEITVTAAVGQTTAAGNELLGVLTLTTNDPAKKKIDLPLKVRASGVTLALTPSNVGFGGYPVNTPAIPETLVLQNTGNLPATIGFTQPTDPQFSIGWDGGPAEVVVAPMASVPGLTAHFTPRSNAASMGSAAIVVAEPVCGTILSEIKMTGRGLSGEVSFSETDVYFGVDGGVDCGNTATSKTFTIRNTGNTAFSWTGTLAKGAASPFTFMPGAGIVAAATTDAGISIVTVTPKQIPGMSSTAVDAFGDTLEIVTDIPSETARQITLHQTATGAVLSFSAPSIDFGRVPVNETSSAPLTLINSGNQTAIISLSSSEPKFAVTPAGPMPLDRSIATVVTFTPDASVPMGETGLLTMALADGGGVLCAPLPAPVTMAGEGTSGSVSYTPASLDFGQVSCGTAGSAQVVTFKNSGNQAYAITRLVLGISDGGSPFTVSMSPDSGIVEGDGGTVVITVTPRAIPQTSAVTPNLYGDTLTVTTNDGGDGSNDIALTMTASGAIFGISTTSLPFGSVPVGAMATQQFTIDNNGNAPGTISITTGQAAFTLPQNAVVAANASFNATGGFTPAMVGPVSATGNVTVSAATVLCRPLPFTTMPLSGSGTTSNALQLNPSSLTFGAAGMVPCGTTAPPKTINVSNNASVPLTLTYSLGINDGGSPYTVSGPSQIFPQDGGTITVTAKLMKPVSSTAPDFYADTLSIRAVGGPIDESRVIALHQTAQGAILTFNPAALSFTTNGVIVGNQAKPFTVNNLGNANAAYTLAIGGTHPAQFSVSPPNGNVAGGMSAPETATFYGELFAPQRTGTVIVSTVSTLCGPLPPPLALTGN